MGINLPGQLKMIQLMFPSIVWNMSQYDAHVIYITHDLLKIT